jgi:PIN domain nuclease of toxin-antitoxin system
VETPRPGVVLDASAAIALLLDESGADTVGSLLGSGDDARMSTVNAAEVVDVLVRVRGGEPDVVIGRVDELLSSVVQPVAPSVELAIRAGELRARHFRRDQRVSLADCFVLATAESGDCIVTTDGTLATAAREEGVDVALLEAASS